MNVSSDDRSMDKKNVIFMQFTWISKKRRIQHPISFVILQSLSTHYFRYTNYFRNRELNWNLDNICNVKVAKSGMSNHLWRLQRLFSRDYACWPDVTKYSPRHSRTFTSRRLLFEFRARRVARVVKSITIILWIIYSVMDEQLRR